MAPNPRGNAADTRHVAIHGDLSGVEISLLDSAVIGRDISLFGEGGQTVRTSQVLVGAHTSPSDTKASSARIRLPQSAVELLHHDGLFPQLRKSSESPCEVIAGAGTLRTYTITECAYVELSTDSPVQLRDWDRLFFASIAALLRLWTGDPQLWFGASGAVAAQCEVAISGNDYCPLFTAGTEDPYWPGHILLPTTELDHETIRNWIDLDRKIAPLGDVIGRQQLLAMMPLEAAVLVTLSSLEGFHRATSMPKRGHLPTFISRVPPESLPNLKLELENLLVQAVSPNNHEWMRGQVKKLTQEKDGYTFIDRLRVCAADAGAVAPGLCGPDLEQWLQQALKIRNGLAHQSRAGKMFTINDAHDYISIARGAGWVGRVLALTYLGVAPDRLHHALVNYHPFQYDLAVMDDLRNDDFSHLETFLAGGT